jgi:hypothetical protein
MVFKFFAIVAVNDKCPEGEASTKRYKYIAIVAVNQGVLKGMQVPKIGL